MPSFQTQRRIGHTAAQMFALVADIAAYPEFVPMCLTLRVRSRTPDGEGRTILVADMEAGYKAIREKFTSRVTLDEAGNQILVEYIDGPFSHLINRWNFADLADGNSPACRVDFFIDYAFKSRMLGLLVGGMFDIAFRKMVEAFEKRADQVYGRPIA